MLHTLLYLELAPSRQVQLFGSLQSDLFSHNYLLQRYLYFMFDFVSEAQEAYATQ
jgi:hypothetical protein